MKICMSTIKMFFFSWLLSLPNLLTKQAYAELLEEEDIKIPAWFAFNSKDGVNVVSGDSLLECGSIAESCNKVVAVGINCTPPRFIHDLIVLLKKVYFGSLVLMNLLFNFFLHYYLVQFQF